MRIAKTLKNRKEKYRKKTFIMAEANSTEETRPTATVDDKDEWSTWRMETNDENIESRKRLFINYIPSNVYERSLERLLSQFGHLSEVSIWRDKNTKQSMGKATVEFVNESDARRCMEAANSTHRLILENNYLAVDYLRKSRNRRREQAKQRTQVESAQATTSAQAGHQLSAKDLKETNDTTHCGFNINDLPYQLLISIFRNLCLRDLCTVEKGNENLKNPK